MVPRPGVILQGLGIADFFGGAAIYAACVLLVPELRARERATSLLRCNAKGGTGSLTKRTEYRQYAQACLEVADISSDQRTRAVFVQMAQVWFRLAEGETSLKNDVQGDEP